MADQITTKPFLSRRQQRWAFANKKPFAKRWAKETPSFAALPESKDAGTTAGASLHGPGGLLSIPGMGRLRRRLKAKRIAGNLYRGDTGQFQAGGASTPSSDAPAKKPPAASSTTARRRKPAKTEQERTERRQVDQQARDDARAAQRTQNRADVLRSLNIAPDGAEALAALRDGQQPDAAAIARAGFVDAGLVEQAADGSYRMTPAGRAVLSAADAGDRGRAGDTISGGRDRVMTRRQRQQAAAERKKPQPVKAGGGGDKAKPKPAIDVAGRMARINARLAKMRRRQGRAKSFTVYKSHDGTPRWLARTTTAYRDRDREIIAIKALDQDSQRMTAAGQFGPLRMWHLGRPDPLDPAQPWGPGVDVGDCDFSMQVGRTRVESGTFKSASLAQRIAATAGEYELSPGFFHPPDQPGADGVFTAIRTFERSLVPIKYGRASNLFTGLTVKEQRMDPQEENRRLKAVISQLGLSQEQAAALAGGIVQADKSAQQQGIAYKSDDSGQTIVINGVTYKAEQPAAPEPPPDVVINGVTYKAAPPFVAEVEEEDKADFAEGEAVGEEMADMGMDDAQLVAAIADAVVAKIAPLFGDMKMSEMKALFTTKDDSRTQEIAALKAAQAKLSERLAQLSGDQPAAPMPDDVAAALKSAGPQSPNATPAPESAVQAYAIQTFPQLYQQAPTGGFGGWAPQQPMPPQQP